MNFEDRLREAAAEANRIIMSDLPEPEDCVHEFSPKFERAVRRMTRRAETPVRYRLRQAACVAVALLSLVSAYLMVNTDAQARFFGWVKEQYDILIHYIFEGGQSEGPIKPGHYRLSYLPEGYSERSVHVQQTGTTILYKNANGTSIRFHYTLNVDGHHLFVGGEIMSEQIVQINGKDAQFYEPIDTDVAPTIVWKNKEGNILFILSGYMELEELVKMAESVT